MSARRNSAGQFAATRKPPEDLEFRYPDCPYCLKETDSDGDSIRCYSCEASWSVNGTRGEWDNPGDIACPSAIKPYDRPDLAPEHESIRHLIERCYLADGHADKHQSVDGIRKWDDDDPYITKESDR